MHRRSWRRRCKRQGPVQRREHRSETQARQRTIPTPRPVASSPASYWLARRTRQSRISDVRFWGSDSGRRNCRAATNALPCSPTRPCKPCLMELWHVRTTVQAAPPSGWRRTSTYGASSLSMHSCALRARRCQPPAHSRRVPICVRGSRPRHAMPTRWRCMRCAVSRISACHSDLYAGPRRSDCLSLVDAGQRQRVEAELIALTLDFPRRTPPG